MEKRELIEKFLNGKCNESELAHLQQLLDDQPNLIEDFLQYEDWENSAITEPDETHKNQLWAGIRSRTKSKIIPIKIFKAAAIAASVILVLSLSIYLVSNNSSQLAKTENKTYTNQVIRSANIDGKENKIMTLEDGSTIILYPNAVLEYSANFKTNRVVRLLSGIAGFDVAKDKEHPFSVIAKDVTTTALGTRFIVDETGTKVRVQLYEGRVAIKHISGISGDGPTLLSAGEQYTIDSALQQAVVTLIKPEKTYLTQQNTNVFALPKPSANASLKFLNVPITSVLQELSNVFNTKINYNASELDKIYFTGSFKVSDSLNNILRLLLPINGLQMKTNDDEIAIARIASPPSATKAEDSINTAHSVVKAKPFHATYENAELAKVFEDLRTNLHLNITYTGADLKNKYFTGEIRPGDNIRSVLKAICRMNDLQFSETTKGFKITRQ